MQRRGRGIGLSDQRHPHCIFNSLDEAEAALTEALLDLDDDPIALQMLTGYG